MDSGPQIQNGTYTGSVCEHTFVEQQEMHVLTVTPSLGKGQLCLLLGEGYHTTTSRKKQALL